MSTSTPKAARGRRATRNDVARLAGVSTAVVSYVLNDGPRRVSPESRAQVLDAVDKLGYIPNQVARSLAGQRTRTLGLIAPTLLNPVWSRLVLGVNEVALPESVLLMVCDVEEDPALDAHYAEALASKQVDGVILIPTAPPEATLTILRRSGVPCVVVESATPLAPSVVVDAVATGEIVTQHLIDLGHRRIGFLREHRTSLDSWRRWIGFQQAHARAGLEIDDALVVDTDVAAGISVVDGSRAGAEALLDVVPRPTAVFAHNDLIAIAVLQAARERGLNVPDDLSIVGVDDSETGRYIDPPLTTMAFPSRELGRVSARHLLGLIDGEDQPPLTVIAPPSDLVRRASTAPPRA